MSRPDPPSPRASQLRRFKRLVKLLALLSFGAALLSVLFVASGSQGSHVHLLIATALGVGLTVFVGTALMSLALLSSSSGRDEEAARYQETHEE